MVIGIGVIIFIALLFVVSFLSLNSITTAESDEAAMQGY